jgi:hypothetical protein
MAHLSGNCKGFTAHKILKKANEFDLRLKQKLSSLLFRKKLSLAPGDQVIIDDLKMNGVHVTSCEHLFNDMSKSILSVFADAAADLNISEADLIPVHLHQKVSSVDMIPSVLFSKYPEIFFLGLSDRILNIAEAYLGLPAAYHGVALRRSVIGGQEVGTRLWHQDDEDFRVLRIVIYLNDVSEGGGPFEYIPRSYGLSYNDLESIGSRLTEENILKVVPQHLIRQCYGKKGTVIISDTSNTFHHEKLQVTQNRSVAMFGYSSRLPKNLLGAKSHFPIESLKDQLNALLSPNQIPYVYGWR